MNRREFLVGSTVATLAAAGAMGEPDAAAAKPVRIGVIGVGARGTILLQTLLAMPNVSVPAICDIDDQHLNGAIDLARKAQGTAPAGYSKDAHDYRRLLAREDLDAVMITTPPDWHAEMAVDAMRAGKHVGSEVPGTRTIEQCWEIVKTKEATGRRYMLLENYYYSCDNMMAANMASQGVFGETYYAECAYIHNANALRFNPDGSLTWRGEIMRKSPGNVYPTHSLGPVAKWLDINHSDRFVSLTSMVSKPAALHAYAKKKFGAGSEQAKIRWTCGGMCVTLIKTERDRLITVHYDATSPRIASNFHLIQGTNGIFDSRKGIYLEGETPAEEWYPWHRLHDKYGHPYWKEHEDDARKAGHGGGDYFVISDFVDMVRQDREPTIDVYDSAAWSAVTPLSQESIRKGGGEVRFPDFTVKRAPHEPPRHHTRT